MNGERHKILDMLAQGKITTAEAERLLDAVEDSDGRRGGAEPSAGGKTKRQFLRVVVDETGGDHVDIRIPLQLIRAGVKLGGLLPTEVRGKVGESLAQKGINFDLGSVKPGDVEALVDALAEMSVEVRDNEDHVRIFCE